MIIFNLVKEVFTHSIGNWWMVFNLTSLTSKENKEKIMISKVSLSKTIKPNKFRKDLKKTNPIYLKLLKISTKKYFVPRKILVLLKRVAAFKIVREFWKLHSLHQKGVNMI